MPSFMHVEHSYTSNSRKRCRGTPTGKTPVQASKKAPMVGWFAILIFISNINMHVYLDMYTSTFINFMHLWKKRKYDGPN